MLSDWGSWDGAFNELTASVCRDLVAIVSGQAEHVCVPLQGSGTFAVEAALGTLVPKSGKVLVPDNGSYCKRIVRILGYPGRRAVVLPHEEQRTGRPRAHRCRAGCRPGDHARGTGALRDRHRDPESAAQIAAIVAKHGRGLIVDAMSSYGAIRSTRGASASDALVAASGKCLEGVPGMGFVIAGQRGARGFGRQQLLRSPWICSISGNTCRRPVSGVSRRPRM